MKYPPQNVQRHFLFVSKLLFSVLAEHFSAVKEHAQKLRELKPETAHQTTR